MAERIPQAFESERGILAVVLLCGDALMDEAIGLGLTAEDFSTQRHRLIFGAMASLHQRHDPIELVTLLDYLTGADQLEQAGGAASLAKLIDGEPRRESVEYYVRAVQEASRRRELLRACNQASNLLMDGSEIGEAQRLVDGAIEHAIPDRFMSIEDLCYRYMADLEDRQHREQTASGLPTGFFEFDRRTFGLQRGELVMIAARPSQGKTTWAMNIGQNVGESGHGVAVFSLEMSKIALAEKTISRTAGIDSYALRSGHLTSLEWSKATEGLGRISGVPMWICDESNMTPARVKAMARMLARKTPLSVIMVDFLQLMNGDTKGQGRFEMVGQNARELKSLARDLNVCVVGLSQLNRSVENRTDPEPHLSDLRESGEIEQVADVIAFLYCEKLAADKSNQGIVKVKLGKNRNGVTGIFELRYDRPLNRFENIYH